MARRRTATRTDKAFENELVNPAMSLSTGMFYAARNPRLALYGFARWRCIPEPFSGNWLPGVTFRIDFCAGGPSPGHLRGNGFQN